MPTPIKLPRHILDLPPYTPIEPFEVLSERIGRSPEHIIKLDANENPYGMSPRVREALADLQFGHIYPDPESRALRKSLGAFCGVDPSHLFPGAGADELIDLIMRVTIEKGDRIINSPPTFGMYRFDGDLNGARVVDIARNEDFSLKIEEIEEAVRTHSPKLLFLTSPNNPDGSVLPVEVIERFLNLPVLLILDEAYIEFTSPADLGRSNSLITHVPKHDNLVVLRTFSKLAGLAGLRVGYGAFPTWMMDILWKAKQPYNINVAASVAAIAAMQDVTHLQGTVTSLVAERERLYQALKEISWLSPYPSHSNFILCKVNGKNALRLKEHLATAHGIFIRYFNKPGLEDCIRISIGKPEQNDALLAVLQKS